MSGLLGSAADSTTVLPPVIRRINLQALISCFLCCCYCARYSAGPLPCCTSHGARRRPYTSVAAHPTSSPRVSCCCACRWASALAKASQDEPRVWLQACICPCPPVPGVFRRTRQRHVLVPASMTSVFFRLPRVSC